MWSCATCRAAFRRGFDRCPTDGTVLSPWDGDPVIETTINGLYEVEECIGEGSMGRVYRAHHLLLQRRQVALKILLGDLAATVAMRLRFTREAQAASLLSHPNVVPVLDFGKTQEGLLYLAMEYVEGPSLASIVAEQGPLAPARTVALARQLCLGLAHAHAQGLIHRDFKPDNVLVVGGHGGEVPRIADFGLAIFCENDEAEQHPARLTSAGMVVGTPIYTAPEQALDHRLDQRVDLFALGVTMYEMLAGRLPFDEGSAVQVLHDNLAARRPPISERAPGVSVPPALEQIVQRLISADRDERFASAHDVIAALDRLEPETPARRTAVSGPIAAPAPAPTRRRRVGAAAVVAALACAVAFLWPNGSRREEAAPPREPIATRQLGTVAAIPVPALRPPVEPDLVPAQRRPAKASAAPPRRRVRRPLPPPMSVEKPARPPAVGPVEEVELEIAGHPPMASPTPAPPPAPDRRWSATLLAPPWSVPAAPRPAPERTVRDATLSIEGLAVSGSLSHLEVERAIDRVEPRLAECHRTSRAFARGPVLVSFKIDENGRAQEVRARGGPSGLASCIAGSIAAVRTRLTPDVGEVRVSLRVDFVPREAR